jgi:hypothetical protein
VTIPGEVISRGRLPFVTTIPIRPVAAPLAERSPMPPLRQSTEIQGNVLAAFSTFSTRTTRT